MPDGRNALANHDARASRKTVVEKVMTSDSFLSRELGKAPLEEHDGNLVADIGHLPNDLKIMVQGAREHNLKDVDLEFPETAWSCSQACRGPASHRWLSTRCSRRASAGMSNRFPPMPASSSGRWTNRMSISSRV